MSTVEYTFTCVLYMKMCFLALGVYLTWVFYLLKTNRETRINFTSSLQLS